MLTARAFIWPKAQKTFWATHNYHLVGRVFSITPSPQFAFFKVLHRKLRPHLQSFFSPVLILHLISPRTRAALGEAEISDVPWANSDGEVDLVTRYCQRRSIKREKCMRAAQWTGQHDRQGQPLWGQVTWSHFQIRKSPETQAKNAEKGMGGTGLLQQIMEHENTPGMLFGNLPWRCQRTHIVFFLCKETSTVLLGK